VRDVVDRDGRLGDVGGEDDLADAGWRFVENLALVRRGHRAVQGQNHALVWIPEDPIRSHQVVELGDLVPAGEKDEDRAVGILAVGRRVGDYLSHQVLHQVHVHLVV
jgi:hypothetical protein